MKRCGKGSGPVNRPHRRAGRARAGISASAEMPSIMQPSLAKGVDIEIEQGEAVPVVPGGQPLALHRRPTEVATPWPSGPVVASTPLVQRYSGCPGHREPSWRNVLRSSSVTVARPSTS
jgi:hypothetical protein